MNALKLMNAAAMLAHTAAMRVRVAVVASAPPPRLPQPRDLGGRPRASRPPSRVARPRVASGSRPLSSQDSTGVNAPRAFVPPAREYSVGDYIHLPLELSGCMGSGHAEIQETTSTGYKVVVCDLTGPFPKRYCNSNFKNGDEIEIRTADAKGVDRVVAPGHSIFPNSGGSQKTRWGSRRWWHLLFVVISEFMFLVARIVLKCLVRWPVFVIAHQTGFILMSLAGFLFVCCCVYELVSPLLTHESGKRPDTAPQLLKNPLEKYGVLVGAALLASWYSFAIVLRKYWAHTPGSEALDVKFGFFTLFMVSLCAKGIRAGLFGFSFYRAANATAFFFWEELTLVVSGLIGSLVLGFLGVGFKPETSNAALGHVVALFWENVFKVVMVGVAHCLFMGHCRGGKNNNSQGLKFWESRQVSHDTGSMYTFLRGMDLKQITKYAVSAHLILDMVQYLFTLLTGTIARKVKPEDGAHRLMLSGDFGNGISYFASVLSPGLYFAGGLERVFLEEIVFPNLDLSKHAKVIEALCVRYEKSMPADFARLEPHLFSSGGCCSIPDASSVTLFPLLKI